MSVGRNLQSDEYQPVSPRAVRKVRELVAEERNDQLKLRSTSPGRLFRFPVRLRL